MAKSKKYVISREVYKYPYCAKLDDTEDYLSDKVCRGTIKIRKKIVRKTKRVVVYGQLIATLGDGLAPSFAIGLPILPTTPAIIKIIHSDRSSLKQEIFASAIQQLPAKNHFTESELNILYRLSCECTNPTNSLSREEVINKITNLRGGDSVDVAKGLIIVAAAVAGILLAESASGFILSPHAFIPPHLQWLYGDNAVPGQYGYGKGAGPRSLTVTGLARNAGSEKKPPSPGATQPLKTRAQRNTPNPKDRSILVESRPELIIRRGQAQFKTKDHGALAGLPYKIKKNGGTSTARTDENIDGFMDAVEEIVENPNSIWFEEGTYQGGTSREVESINIYNEEENRIAIFK